MRITNTILGLMHLAAYVAKKIEIDKRKSHAMQHKKFNDIGAEVEQIVFLVKRSHGNDGLF